MRDITKIILAAITIGVGISANIVYFHDMPIYTFRALEELSKTNKRFALTSEEKELTKAKPYLPKGFYLGGF